MSAQMSGGPSTATQWREKAREQREANAVPLPLPSGAVVMATRPPIEVWVSSGKMPQTLTADVQRVFGETKGDPDEIEAAFEELGEERSARLLVFIRDAVNAAIVRPRIVLTVEGVERTYGARIDGVPTGDKDAETGLPVVRTLLADEISAAEVPPGDHAYIFGWILQGCPDVPVKTVRGDVTVETVRTFRNERGKQPARSRKGGGKRGKVGK